MTKKKVAAVTRKPRKRAKPSLVILPDAKALAEIVNGNSLADLIALLKGMPESHRELAAQALAKEKPQNRPLAYTPEQMIAALHEARGLVSYAARLVGCADDTVRIYARRFPEVKAAMDDARERMLDRGENSLYRAIEAEEEWATKFILARLGKDRGYTERIETREIPPVRVTFEQEPGSGAEAGADAAETIH